MTNQLSLSGMDAIARQIADTRDAVKDGMESMKSTTQHIDESISDMTTGIIETIMGCCRELSDQQIVLDSGALVGELAPAIDQQLGQRQNMSSRGVY